MRKSILASITFPLLGACNSLFYYPDNILYRSPDSVGVQYEAIKIPVGEKDSVSAWIFHTEKPRKGVVIHFHGNAQNMSSHMDFVLWTIEYGYDLVTFDYRGYGQSTGSPSRERTVEDGVATLHEMRIRYPQDNLFVIGQSLGGAVAVPSIALSDVEVKALVLDSTFSDYRTIVRSKLASIWLTWPLQWPLSFLVTRDYSPVDYVDKLKTPVLMFHARQDPVVPYSEGAALYQKLHTVVPAKLVSLNQMGHTTPFSPGVTTYHKCVTEFFETLIPECL